MIPLRCVHCAGQLPGAWHATQQLWRTCADCAAWQVWLWTQVPPALREGGHMMGWLVALLGCLIVLIAYDIYLTWCSMRQRERIMQRLERIAAEGAEERW